MDQDSIGDLFPCLRGLQAEGGGHYSAMHLCCTYVFPFKKVNNLVYIQYKMLQLALSLRTNLWFTCSHTVDTLPFREISTPIIIYEQFALTNAQLYYT